MTTEPNPTSETNRKENGSLDHSPRAVRRSTPPYSFWIDVYSFLMVGIILAYYAVMVYFAGKLLVWTADIIPQLATFGPWTVVHILAIAAFVFLFVRTIRHLIIASLGLVTRVHDEVPEAGEGIQLSREEFPNLFDLVRDVGKQVGAPMPDEVRLNHPPESFTVELRDFGLLTRRRLVLVLSLPQMMVLSVDELRVILAHELAHFGRGDTRLIVFCSRFLASLEKSIESIGHRWWHWIDPIYWFQLGYHRAFALLSAPIQRHQELRADCISAATCGGELAARTLLKDCLLSLQFTAAQASFDPSQNGHPDGNFFAWFRGQWRDFTPTGQDYLLERFERDEQASFWDPDPTISQRVALMRSFPEQPAHPTEPARDLLGGVPELEQQLHELMYRAELAAADDPTP